MPLPTLTWSIATETLISATTLAYDTFLNAIETMVNASAGWRVNAKNLDAGNSRGWVELAPRTALSGVAAGRVLILFSTGTVAGAAGTERPLQACRNAPWASSTTVLACKLWVGFSDNANSTLSVGPANDPWTSATPYGAANWSKLFPLNATVPVANSFLNVIDSAEGICLYWTAAGTTANEINYVIAGRLLESADGETGNWMCAGGGAAGDSAASFTGWATVVSGQSGAPVSEASLQHSAGNFVRSWAAALSSGNLFGIGRAWSAANNNAVSGSMSNASVALFQAIVLGGGIYTAGSSDQFVGIFRQVRWGPAAYRGQQLFNAGVKQGICLNYTSSAGGAKPFGLWFDDFR